MDNVSAHLNQTQLFTAETATRTLPLVRAIVTDASKLYQQIVDRRSRLESLRLQTPVIDEHGMHAEELIDIEESLDRSGRELERFLTELDDLGVSSRHAILGSVGFPAVIEGQLVELCWTLDDDEVGFFHPIGGAPEDRQPLPAASVI